MGTIYKNYEILVAVHKISLFCIAAHFIWPMERKLWPFIITNNTYSGAL